MMHQFLKKLELNYKTKYYLTKKNRGDLKTQKMKTVDQHHKTKKNLVLNRSELVKWRHQIHPMCNTKIKLKILKCTFFCKIL